MNHCSSSAHRLVYVKSHYEGFDIQRVAYPKNPGIVTESERLCNLGMVAESKRLVRFVSTNFQRALFHLLFGLEPASARHNVSKHFFFQVCLLALPSAPGRCLGPGRSLTWCLIWLTSYQSFHPSPFPGRAMPTVTLRPRPPDPLGGGAAALPVARELHEVHGPPGNGSSACDSGGGGRGGGGGGAECTGTDSEGFRARILGPSS